MAKEDTHYSKLGLTRDATPEEIRRAYHVSARRFHPDVNIEGEATEKFIQIQEAYDILSDPQKRSDYDKTLPPEEELAAYYRSSILYSRSALQVLDEPQLIYILLELLPPQEGIILPSLPLNVCLVLDRSTSMQGERMDTVKSTAIEVVRQLGSDDIFSLVSFSDRAEVLIPASYRSDRRTIETKIQMIKPSGATEIYQGLLTGLQEIKYNYSKQRINHIILITDGRTYGDEDDCLNVADQAASYGIGISGLGIGYDWNDKFLDSLASRTGGNSTYISHTADIKHVLLDRFRSFGRTYAENVRFDFAPKRNVDMRYAFRISPNSSRLETEPPIRLGNIPGDNPLAVLFELEISPIKNENEQFTLANGRLTAEIPSQTSATTARRLRLSRPVVSDDTHQSPPPALMKAIYHLTLYRMQERVQEKLDEGNIEGAVLHLQNLATNLFSQGERKLAETVLREAENVRWNQNLSEEGKKQIKYGTRALLLPAQAPSHK